MTVVELLSKGWTQGAAARNKDGQAVDSESSLAVQWCHTGAAWVAYSKTNRLFEYYTHVHGLLPAHQCLYASGACALVHNDASTTTQAEVIAIAAKAEALMAQ